MQKSVWCAINISEGQNSETIAKLKTLIEQTEQVDLLHLDLGKSVNRSVFSIFSTLDALPNFTLQFFELVLDLVDMSKQTGSHPRIGAVDVFPVVPIGETTMLEAKEVVEQIAPAISNAFLLPIYLYEASQNKKHRTRLEQIRKGGYENFSKKIKLPSWQPDYGLAVFNSKNGVTVMGARKPLIAINFTLKTSDVEVAKQIAKQIRASNKTSVYALASVKAIGWQLPEFNTVQVSCNLTDSKKTSIKKLFDTIQILALNQQTVIKETELIGLLLKSDLIDGFVDEIEAVNYLKLAGNNNISNRIISF